MSPRHSTDDDMSAALAEDAAKLEALGQDSGMSISDLMDGPEWTSYIGAGDPPVPAGTMVTIRFRDGSEMTDVVRAGAQWSSGEEGYEDGADVVSYRIEEPVCVAVPPPGLGFKCAKRGCGALAIIGSPCRDWDCPQSTVSAAEYRFAIYRLRDLCGALQTLGYGKTSDRPLPGEFDTAMDFLAKHDRRAG